MNKKLILNLKNKKSDIANVQNKIDHFCDKHSLPERLKNELNLILDELIINTILYGYIDQQDHNITIKIFLSADDLKIIYRDDGIEFDPTKQQEPSHLSESASEKPLGGLGIHLVKNLMDAIEYKRDKGRNILILTKKLENKN